jgi:hypothetical protein
MVKSMRRIAIVALACAAGPVRAAAPAKPAPDVTVMAIGANASYDASLQTLRFPTRDAWQAA